ncbi:MAG: ergothioneine biosynthesis protein EgtB [Betaproteobacteria bacterium]|nr:ergothioneine biosynthesis protein EgtB [Betaproteobacteria bacterium]
MQRQGELLQAFRAVRGQTTALAAGLSAEDCMVQSMTDASPVKWHLAHVTWFFETFVLERALPAAGRAFRPFCQPFRVLFNSYYLGVGPMHPRPERGVLSRPGLEEVLEYRRAVDEQLGGLLETAQLCAAHLDLVELGLHHEQQHQELILTDLKHHFSRNPLLPAYRAPCAPAAGAGLPDIGFIAYAGGRSHLGHDGRGFAFDNEGPRHGVWLEPFALGTRLVSNGEYLRFMAEEGYRRPELWLSDAWDTVRREGWQAPLYWRRAEDGWRVFTLGGERPVEPNEALCHVSYYEAEAYARWAGARLPSEAQWEHAARAAWPNPAGEGVAGTQAGNFLEDGHFHPRPPQAGAGPGAVAQLFGDAWEWTQSAYLPYPGYRPAAGAVGEYNGKFMINQMVLRGGSCATPRSHIRPSYRNFFPPAARWQFSGIRLVRDG